LRVPRQLAIVSPWLERLLLANQFCRFFFALCLLRDQVFGCATVFSVGVCV